MAVDPEVRKAMDGAFAEAPPIDTPAADDAPIDVVRELRRLARTAGDARTRAQALKWLMDAEKEAKANGDGGDGYPGDGAEYPFFPLDGEASDQEIFEVYDRGIAADIEMAFRPSGDPLGGLYPNIRRAVLTVAREVMKDQVAAATLATAARCERKISGDLELPPEVAEAVKNLESSDLQLPAAVRQILTWLASPEPEPEAAAA